MKRRHFLAALAAASAWSAAGRAQARVARVGVLNFGPQPRAGAPEEPVVRHLRALGYIEGRNIAYERRYAAGARERYPELAAALARGKVDVIFAPGSDIARAFRDAAAKVPVVFVVSDDAVGTGLVKSYARPGGMFTGVSLMSPELGGKRLEYLREAIPDLRRLAVLYDGEHEFYLMQMREPARRMGVTLLPFEFDGIGDFSAVFAAARRQGAQAMFVAPNRFTLFYAKRLAELSIEHRIPAISPYDVFAQAGGLLSYGPRLDEAVARAAAQIRRIVEGAAAADVPVEQPTRMALIVNQHTAKALDLELPRSLLLRADQVIE